MMVCILSVAIEVEELSMDKVHIHGDSINLLGIISGQLGYFSFLVDAQRGIGTVPLEIGLSYLLHSPEGTSHSLDETRRGRASEESWWICSIS